MDRPGRKIARGGAYIPTLPPARAKRQVCNIGRPLTLPRFSHRHGAVRKTPGRFVTRGGRFPGTWGVARSRSPVPRHPAVRFGRGLRARAQALRHSCCQWPRPDRIRCTISGFIRSQRARVGNVQRGDAMKVGFPIKPPDYTRGETAARGAVASYYG